MALSRIWSAFVIIAVLVASIRIVASDNKVIFSSMVTGKSGDTIHLRQTDTTTFSEIQLHQLDSLGYMAVGNASVKRTGNGKLEYYQLQNADGIIETCKSAVNISIGLIGIMALFMGFMSIAERAGGIRLLSKIIGPFFSKLFPELPKGHPAMGHMMMNFSANLLGLDNAATPFGLKAMQSLQEINPSAERASNAQIMFLCLHAAGFSLIPVSVIAVRAALRSANPTDIFVPCMITTFVATMAAMFIVSYKQKINLFQPVIIAWVGGFSALIVLLVIYLNRLSVDGLQTFSSILSNGLILLIFLLIILGALYKRIDVFDAFIDGAKGGFETAVKIIPYLVGMLVAISLLRTSGSFDMVIDGMKTFFAFLGMDTRFVDALPTALIRPLSGGGARGMMVSTMTTFGADSFPGRLSSIMQGASDTTFYVIAVYFGAVNIKDTRYAVGAMLLADLVGVITAILLAYMFFGR
ncbi:nucleoside recognition domain-containing protein [Flavisolibacter ginsengisoli]|jgi:spore maturation protein SpmA/spore maturation protein SpmB|uniref:Spore maturation protein SpmA n=1 Tax=Flavisolibacter ginsengisoli DSM 18119 TaxID=1121884 RepID=A0A1M4WX20_9BACT|nr:spore maturation protein [Flavisolibacter ginsengisoli]SHE85603.1 Spore maturation protein SpmA [Flavisolibacter ginsengisoli DSM 18119]